MWIIVLILLHIEHVAFRLQVYGYIDIHIFILRIVLVVFDIAVREWTDIFFELTRHVNQRKCTYAISFGHTLVISPKEGAVCTIPVPSDVVT